MHTAKDFAGIINKGLNDIDFGTSPENLYDPIKYVMKSGGKRIRPVLSLMACELFGGDYRNVLSAALGIEIFHNFTLLHDDMMDNAEIRRGMPVVHCKWNRNIALLSGDAMSVISYKYIADSSNNLEEILSVFSNTALNICEGQQLDMDFEKVEKISEDEYLMMINLKTAVLLACSLKVGALSANASTKDCDCIYEFGRNLGLAFQLQDDYLDVYGDEIKFGKSTGNDIISNKKTFLLTKALKDAKNQDLEKLNYWLSLKEFDNNDKVLSIKNIFNKLEIKEYASKKISEYYQKAFEYFEMVSVPVERKKFLKEFAESLRFRDF